MCGEKHTAEQTTRHAVGSPPRVRGKARQAVYKDIKHGITPACAGKSLARELLLIVSRDHPRVCGEKYVS